MSTEFKDFVDTQAPSLSFDVVEEVEVVATPVKEELPQDPNDDSMLSPEQKQMVKDFVTKIDLSNTSAILQYGAGTQKKMADFSGKALDNVKTKDMGEVGEMITDLVTQLRDFDVEEQEKGFGAFFKRKANKLMSMKSRYDATELNVTKISHALENHQIQLMKDVDMLDKMYELNLNYFKELSMYILAGKEKLQVAKNVELKQMLEKAQASGRPEDAQAAKDYEGLIDRFEKKIYDLELTRTIALQTAPQIRLVQGSDTVMIDKIQSTIVNTIPLWKNQMVIALGVEHSTQAAEAQRQVTDMTNELLKKNAAALKTATIETAKEAERGIVDLETLKQTNESLISTLDEVMRIQSEGRTKRQEAEQELASMENQLKQKLLQMNS